MSWEWAWPSYPRRAAASAWQPPSSFWAPRGAGAYWKKEKEKHTYVQPAVSEPEWKCLGCNEGNWTSRATCRNCKAPKGAGAGSTRHRAENLSMLEALQNVVDNLGDNPLLIEIKQKLMEDVKKLEKKTTDNRSLAKQLFTLEAWVEREEKRIFAAEEQLEEDNKSLAERKVDLQTEMAKLVSLKEAIIKESEFKDTDPDPDEEMILETDTSEMLYKELDIRRKMAAKKDDKGVSFSTKRMKEMEKEADGFQLKIASAKRAKICKEAKKTPTSATAATAGST